MAVKGVSRIIPNGSVWLQGCGKLATVVSYLGGDYFVVKFKDSPEFKTNARDIKTGKVLDKNLISVAGIGYLGYGEYVTKINHIRTSAYEVWRGIVRRCYDESSIGYCSYGGRGVTVEESWHNFQNFAEWYYSELKLMPKEIYTRFSVDKDLKKGRQYSVGNCTLLPYKLNSFIQNKAFSEGMGYVKNSSNPYNKITTTIGLLGKQVYIGTFSTQEESDLAYNVAKNYVNRKMSSEYLSLGLISKYTSDLINEPVNEYNIDDEHILFNNHKTLKKRIDGLFVNKDNLLERCKYKVSSEIY